MPAKAASSGGEHIGNHTHPIDRNAGEPCCALVTADEIDLAEECAAAEEKITKPHEHDHEPYDRR